MIDLNFPFDYIILIITLIIVIFTTWKGFVHSILSLLTWIGSIIITLYSYQSFANIINNQILKISFFQNYETLSSYLSIILSIPIIFLISLFILKRLRKIISADLDKQIFGTIIDKIFGILYGIFFSYLIFSSIIFIMYQINMEDLVFWLSEKSQITNIIQSFNREYIYSFLIDGYQEVEQY